jgi:putative ABC transport system permease protein
MRVVGLRKVNWDTMRVNFFVLTPPVFLRGLSGKLDHQFSPVAGQGRVINRLVRDFPT